MTKPFISLCMIVKNEEKVLERCLDSIVNTVDEIVIVDTGSTDSTKDIARKYTSQVFEIEWVDDFSYARNYAASKANGEWVLVLDADEYVEKDSTGSFRKQLEESKDNVDAYSVKIINFTGKNASTTVQNYHDRVYRNNGKIEYIRKIHEQFTRIDGKDLSIDRASLTIYHSGYMSAVVQEKGKLERNKILIDQEMNAGNNAFDYFNRGNEEVSKGNYQVALEFYLQAYELKSNMLLQWVPICLIQIISCLIELKRYEDAINVAKDAGDFYIETVEFKYLIGEVLFLRKQLTDAKEMFEWILQQEPQESFLRPDFADKQPHFRLAEILFYEKDFKHAIHHYMSVLNIDKNHEDAIERSLITLLKFHTANEISSFLNQNDLVNERNYETYIKVCFQQGALQLAVKIAEMFKSNHEKLEVFTNLKLCLVEKNSCFKQYLKALDVEDIRFFINQGFLNIIDLVLLHNLTLDKKDFSEVHSILGDEKQIKLISSLLQNDSFSEDINLDLYVASVFYLIKYKKMEELISLLIYIDRVDLEAIVKVARLLFDEGFKVEALRLYDRADWSEFVEEDFVNVIESLLSTKNMDGALSVSEVALNRFSEDFRFYQYILENSTDSFQYSSILGKSEKFMTNID